VTWKANRLALRQGSLFPLCASAIAGIVIITPVLVVLWRSLTSGKLGFTVAINASNYLRVFADKDIWPMLSNSIVYAGGSALLGTGYNLTNAAPMGMIRRAPKRSMAAPATRLNGEYP